MLVEIRRFQLSSHAAGLQIGLLEIHHQFMPSINYANMHRKLATPKTFKKTDKSIIERIKRDLQLNFFTLTKEIFETGR